MFLFIPPRVTTWARQTRQRRIPPPPLRGSPAKRNPLPRVARRIAAPVATGRRPVGAKAPSRSGPVSPRGLVEQVAPLRPRGAALARPPPPPGAGEGAAPHGVARTECPAKRSPPHLNPLPQAGEGAGPLARGRPSNGVALPRSDPSTERPPTEWATAREPAPVASSAYPRPPPTNPVRSLFELAALAQRQRGCDRTSSRSLSVRLRNAAVQLRIAGVLLRNAAVLLRIAAVRSPIAAVLLRIAAVQLRIAAVQLRITALRSPSAALRTASAPVREPSAPVREPPTPVREPSAPVREPSAPVREPSAPVREPSAPVREPAAPVREPAAPVFPAATGPHPPTRHQRPGRSRDRLGTQSARAARRAGPPGGPISNARRQASVSFFFLPSTEWATEWKINIAFAAVCVAWGRNSGTNPSLMLLAVMITGAGVA